MKRKLLGYVGVDSGQLMVTDPCYIDSEWTQMGFQDIRMYEHKKTKRTFKYETFWEPATVKASQAKTAKLEIFQSYDAITSTGKSMNQMVKAKEVTEVPVPLKQQMIGTYSYGGVCETTLAGKHEINYKKGHAGVAVVFNSGYGDGSYPVYGTFNAEGRCIKVEIEMGDE